MYYQSKYKINLFIPSVGQGQGDFGLCCRQGIHVLQTHLDNFIFFLVLQSGTGNAWCDHGWWWALLSTWLYLPLCYRVVLEMPGVTMVDDGLCCPLDCIYLCVTEWYWKCLVWPWLMMGFTVHLIVFTFVLQSGTGNAWCDRGWWWALLSSWLYFLLYFRVVLEMPGATVVDDGLCCLLDHIFLHGCLVGVSLLHQGTSSIPFRSVHQLSQAKLWLCLYWGRDINVCVKKLARCVHCWIYI